MLSRLNDRCPSDHIHQHLVGGRAANAAFYPPALMTNIRGGVRGTADAEFKDAEHGVTMDVAMTCAGALHDLPAHSLCAAYRESDLNHDNAQKSLKFKFLNGYTKTINLDSFFKDVYKDEYTMEPLPREETKAVIYDELEYFCDKVFRGVKYEEAIKDPDGKIIGSRWVNCNKGDAENPDVLHPLSRPSACCLANGLQRR